MNVLIRSSVLGFRCILSTVNLASSSGFSTQVIGVVKAGVVEAAGLSGHLWVHAGCEP